MSKINGKHIIDRCMASSFLRSLFLALFFAVLFQALYSVYSPSDLVESESAGTRHADSKVFVAAGYSWSEGRTPYLGGNLDIMYERLYDEVRKKQQLFAYPPNASVLLLPISFLPFQHVFTVIDIVNIVSFLLILVIMCLLTWRNFFESNKKQWLMLVCLCLAVKNQSVWGALNFGQVVFLITLAIVGVWFVKGSGKISSGIKVLLIVICTLKPTCTLLFLFYWAITQTRLVVLAAVPTILLTFLALYYSNGWVWSWGFIAEWFSSVEEYGTYSINKAENLAGGINVLSMIGVPRIALISIGVITSIILGAYVRVKKKDDKDVYVFYFMVFLTSVTLPLHITDYVIFLPLVLLIPALQPRWMVVFLVAAFLFAIPNRIVTAIFQFYYPFYSALVIIFFIFSMKMVASSFKK